MTKLALSVFHLIENLDAACLRMLEDIDSAAREKCDLVVFPEAILGGIDIEGDYTSDSSRCLELDSAHIETLRNSARKHSMGVGFGFLEKEGNLIYDSFLLLGPDGENALHYRRISPGWLTSNADPNFYRCGENPGIAQTPWGKIAVLICGDLFVDGLVDSIAAQKPDFALHIIARAYTFDPDIQQNWDKLEFPWYQAEYAKIGSPVAAVNLVDDKIEDGYIYCGGAWFLRDGKPVASKELMTPGLLFVDLP